MSDLIIISDTATECQKPFYNYALDNAVSTVQASATLHVPMLSSTTRTETDCTGILVKDKVCFDSDTCVNDYEFFVATTSSACNNLLGIGPSQDSSRPNLINALVNDK